MISRLNLTRQEASHIIESIINEVGYHLKASGRLKISTFGTFYVLSKAQRMGRNPKTGEQKPITPRKSISFKSSTNLKQKVNRKQ